MKRTTFLSKVMKAAWTIYRKGGITFGQALTKAWAWAKRKLNVAASSIVSIEAKITRETAKGCYIVSRQYTGWAPKSAIDFISGHPGTQYIEVAAWFAAKERIA